MNRKAIFFLTICLVFSIYSFEVDQKQLFFDQQHKFKILQLTDVHFGAKFSSDFQNIHIIKKLVKQSKPNFVVYTGDTVCSRCHWNPSVPEISSKLCWTMIPYTMITSNSNYAIALGNHDCEEGGEKYRTDLLNYDKQFPHSFSKINDPTISAGSTYYIPIYSSYNHSNPAVIIWVFDTKQKGCMNVTKSYGCVGKDQIDWFIENDKHLRKLYGDYYISLAFAHIPPQEYVTLYNEGEVYGNRFQHIGCPKANSGWIDAMISRKVSALFVGHDHDNDFGGFYHGLELVYGRKTGYGFYGPNYFDRGGRAIEILEIQNEHEKKVVYKHHIIEESGKIVENGPATHRKDKATPC